MTTGRAVTALELLLLTLGGGGAHRVGSGRIDSGGVGCGWVGGDCIGSGWVGGLAGAGRQKAAELLALLRFAVLAAPGAGAVVVAVHSVLLGKVDLASERTDRADRHLDGLTDAVDAATGPALEDAGVFDVEVVVVVEVGDVQPSLHPVFQRHEQPGGDHARHPAREALADVLLRPFGLVVLGQVALGLRGGALALRRVAALLAQRRGQITTYPVGHRPFQRGPQCPVNQQVGVAADRRGEVQVLLEGQPEVTEVLPGVLGLLHRAQEQGVDRRFLGRAAHRLEHRLVGLRRRLAAGKGQPHAANRAGDVVEAGQGRLLVDAVERGHVLFQEVMRHRLVGQQHQVLDHAARGFLTQRNQLHVAVFVHIHLDLAHLEIEAALTQPLLAQFGGNFEQQMEVALQHAGVALERRHRLGVGLNLVVGQPGLAANHAGREGRTQHLAVAGKFQHGAHGQAVFIRHQATDPVAEVLRQHRQHRAGQVDAGGAGVGLGVERRAGPHIVAHVGDMNAHHEGALRRRLDVNGVVEVLGVRAVHGEDVVVAQIQATFQRRLRKAAGNGLGLAHHVVGKSVSQAVLDDHGLGLGGRVVLVAEHAHDLAVDLVLAGMLRPEQLGDHAGTVG